MQQLQKLPNKGIKQCTRNSGHLFTKELLCVRHWARRFIQTVLFNLSFVADTTVPPLLVQNAKLRKVIILPKNH